MCGIIGYVGPRECKPLLLQGLERLEYRGYDSAGIALLEDDGLDYVRAVGNLQNLKDAAGPNGSRCDARARPHALGDARRRHRGERAPADRLRRREARDRPERDRRELPRAARGPRSTDGHTFTSETDAETVAHLIERHYDGDLAEAVRADLRRARGPLRLRRHPPRPPRRARRRAPPDARSSSASATARCSSPRTRPRSCARRAPVQFPDDGEIVEITPAGAVFTRCRRHRGRARAGRARLGRRGRREGRLRDVHAQGDLRAAGGRRARRSATASGTARLVLEGLGHSEDELRELRRIVILACGTAYHAGVVGRYVIEEWARIPVEPDIASEWIYRNPVHRRGHARDRDLAVGRDARHDRGDEARPREGRAHASRSRT